MENLVAHVLQRTQGCAWRTSRFAHGSSSEPQGDADQVWDVQRARHEHGDPDCLTRFWTHDGHRDGLWWWCAHLKRLHSASRHPSFGWPWSFRVPWWTSLSEGTRSLPPQRGRLFGMSKRIRATLVWITTQSSSRLRNLTKRGPTCS